MNITDMLNAFPNMILSSIIAVLTTLWINRNKKKDDIKCLKRALKAELQTLQTLYYQLKISDTPPKNGDDIKIVSIQSNYTTVYEKNADKIGMLEPETAEAVVIAYTHIAAFIDSLRVYGQRWENMIAYERTDNSKYWEYYKSDVDRSFELIHQSQETTLIVVNNAIEMLSII